MDANTVTCSFTMDRALYNEYKSIVVRSGESVKSNLINYMRDVIKFDTPNADTIAAIHEVDELKRDPNKKTYASFGEFLAELDDE